GTVLEPFHVSANWTTSNTTVLSIDTNRIAHAQAEGTATISAFWRAFIYTDGGASGCESGLLHPYAETLCEVLPFRTHRGRIQAQGSNPRLEISKPWSQDDVPSKSDGLRWLDSLWDRLTSSEKRDRQRAYEDARRFILTAPQDGYEAFPFKISRSFRDPARRDPAARIDIEIIAGRAFEGPF
ncbi:MAG TPA: Ig-like domain-containing protein, partial [Pyrinomonadaceae bacterium]